MFYRLFNRDNNCVGRVIYKPKQDTWWLCLKNGYTSLISDTTQGLERWKAGFIAIGYSFETCFPVDVDDIDIDAVAIAA